MIEEIDLSAIQDEAVRKQVRQLLNLVEKQWTQLRVLQEDNQFLRDEINRLKGEQGKPNIKASKAVNVPDHRSGHHCANLRTLRAQICFTAPLRDAVLTTGIHPRSQNGAFC